MEEVSGGDGVISFAHFRPLAAALRRRGFALVEHGDWLVGPGRI